MPSVREGHESFHHSMKRRCFVHDYKGRSIYLITLEVAARRNLLGRVVARDGIPFSVSELSEDALSTVNAPLFEPSELGRRVAEEFMRIGEHVPGVKPLLAQAMPDHFHGILFVTCVINRSLGSIMAGFKGKCSQIARELGMVATSSQKVSLWEEGYHDRILTSDGQLKKMFRYVRDNPRRQALRLAQADLFTTVRCLAGHGHEFHAFGNAFLLQRDIIAQVQCSRSFFGFRREPKADGKGTKIARNSVGEPQVAFSTPEFDARKNELFAAAEKGAVLCSPCISDGEKAIAYAAVDSGHALIVLRNEPFPPRFKPAGRFFDACAEGRLLMLCSVALTRPAPDPGRHITRPAPDLGRHITRSAPDPGRHITHPAPDLGRRITRAECLALNALAAEISGGNAGDVVYRSDAIKG